MSSSFLSTPAAAGPGSAGVAAALLLCVVAATPSYAGTRYKVLVTSGGVYPGHQTGTVSVDDARWRVDFDSESDEPTAFNTIIATDSNDIVALNHANKTWYRLSAIRPPIISSRLFSLPSTGGVRVSRLQIGRPSLYVDDTNGEPGPGHAAQVTVSYSLSVPMGDAVVKGQVHAEITVWMRPESPGLQIPLNALDLRTGLEAVDAKLLPTLAGMSGAPMRSHITVTRTLDGGQPLVHTIRTVVEELTPYSPEPGYFEIPKDYRYQEPVIAFPTASK